MVRSTQLVLVTKYTYWFETVKNEDGSFLPRSLLDFGWSCYFEFQRCRVFKKSIVFAEMLLKIIVCGCANATRNHRGAPRGDGASKWAWISISTCLLEPRESLTSRDQLSRGFFEIVASLYGRAIENIPL